MPTQRPKLLVFDVNETLLDLTAMRRTVAAALGGRGDLLSLWFTTLLHHSLVATVGDHYEDFGTIGAAAMTMVARNQGVELSPAAAREAMAAMGSLPPHPEVPAGLERLKAAGYRMMALSNSSSSTLAAQMKHAGLTGMFEACLSVDEVQMFKPHTYVYNWVAGKLEVQPEECLMVAAHGWDVAGALWAGWRAAFVSRPGAQLYPLAPVPEIVEPDFTLLSERLSELES